MPRIYPRSAYAAALLLATLLATLLTGCNLTSFEDACREKGGHVVTDRETCTVTKTTGTGSKRKTTKATGHRTEQECLDDDGRELDESEGPCS